MESQKEPSGIYYRAWMFLFLISFVPFSLLLGYRVFMVLFKGEPAIFQGGINKGVKLGLQLLQASKVLLLLSLIIFAIPGTPPSAIAIILILGMASAYLSVVVIEVFQIKYRNWWVLNAPHS